MLRDLKLQMVYSRDNCSDLVADFFVPMLSRAVRYDRSTYTFSPEALVVAAAGLAGLINNGGNMRLICHHQLHKDVVQAIIDGHRAAEDAVLESLANRDLTEVDSHNLAGFASSQAADLVGQGRTVGDQSGHPSSGWRHFPPEGRHLH